MKRKNIIAIVGGSGTGKTTASLFLQKIFSWDAVISYTTRPMRVGEKNGREHWFVRPKDKPPTMRMCAYTVFGGHEYWTEWSQFNTLFNSVYVIDEKGLVELLANTRKPSWFNIIKVKLKRAYKQGIGKKRLDRDKSSMHLDDSFYDYVIDNNGSIERFESDLCDLVKTINEKYGNNGDK